MKDDLWEDVVSVSSEFFSGNGGGVCLFPIVRGNSGLIWSRFSDWWLVDKRNMPAAARSCILVSPL